MGDCRTLYLLATAIAFVVHAFIAGVSLVFDVMLHTGLARRARLTVGSLGLRGGIERQARDSQPQDTCHKSLFAFPKISY